MGLFGRSGRKREPAGLEAELAQAPLEVQEILLQLAQPIATPLQEVERLALFEQALALVDRSRSPQLWAVLQNDFAISLYQTRVGDRAENLEQAIAALKAALEVRTRENLPIEWAQTQKNLGIAYFDRIRGKRADNLESAIAAFSAALEVYTRADFPVEWAATQNDLGNTLLQLTRGDRAENLEHAITAFRAALEVRTQGDFPMEWAQTQSNFGLALSDRIQGDKAENLEEAIVAFQAALEIYTREDFPLDWAMTQNSLGIAFANRIRGDRGDNLEQAIAACQAALQIYTKGDFPVQWASILGNLGNALRERIRGDKAEDIDRAIAAYTAALEVYTRAYFPVEWAGIQNNLGAAYAERIRGERADNLERAIAAFQVALEVRTRDDFPVEWAMTQNNLGIAYSDRIHGDRGENLEKGIAAYQVALDVYTRDDFPVEWAMIQSNLGAAYFDRISGDKADNLERAIAAYQAGLEVRTRDGFPADWAATQDNLGSAYYTRIQGDRAENLDKAILAYQAALEVRTREDFPVEWARTQTNLGLALSDRIHGDRAENLEEAIAAYRAALEVRTRDDFPMDWAATQNNLGIAYRVRIRGDRAENLEEAIAAFQAALEVRTREDLPMEWARTQNNLGAAYSERIRGDRGENREKATAAFQAAIDGAHAMGLTDYEHGAAGNLGNLYYEEEQWSSAYHALRTAIAAWEAMRIGYFTEEAKTRLAEENAQLYARMTDTCVRLGHQQEALERAEAGKSRLFLDQLGYDAFPAPTLPSPQQPLLEREASLISELRALEDAIRREKKPAEEWWRQFVARKREKEDDLEKVWAQLEPYAPDYVALRRGEPVRYEQLQVLVDGLHTAAALVEFYTLPDKIITFILRSGEKEPAVVPVPVPEDKLSRHVDNYRREVVDYGERGDIGQRWQELAKPLLAEVLPHLQGAELVYLVPHGLLHYLPLHALQVDGEYLIDRFPIAYAPSAAVLNRVMERTAGVEGTGDRGRALVLGYTSNEEEREVFEGEAEQVAEFFGIKARLGEDATGELLRDKGAEYDILHLSCHGLFHPSDPLASRVLLYDGPLHARDLMELKLDADLVTLSACETALSRRLPGDELVGLTRALLYAGASSVLVTLWSVDAVAALELMGDFYNRMLDKDKGGAKVAAEAVALQEAMLEMRKRQEHPYYWAPFILVGDWR